MIQSVLLRERRAFGVWIGALLLRVLMGTVKRSAASPLGVEGLVPATRLNPSPEAD